MSPALAQGYGVAGDFARHDKLLSARFHDPCLNPARSADTIKSMKTARSFPLLLAGVALALLSGCALFEKENSFPLAGTWKNSVGTIWTIGADGRFDVDIDKDGKRDAWGKCKIDLDVLTIEGTGGLQPKGCNGKGVYHFTRNGDALHFTEVSDRCRLRKKNLVLPWQLQK